MAKATTVAEVKSVQLTAKMLRDVAEANAEHVAPVETAGAMRVAVALEAAEKMADAIGEFEAADAGEVQEAFDKMLNERDRFRKAMRGEL